jgi:hypothetical protein
VRVAALDDVEGNTPALDAVLAELERIQPDVIVFGGDLFCGAQPVEVIDGARSLPSRAFCSATPTASRSPRSPIKSPCYATTSASLSRRSRILARRPTRRLWR